MPAAQAAPNARFQIVDVAALSDLSAKANYAAQGVDLFTSAHIEPELRMMGFFRAAVDASGAVQGVSAGVITDTTFARAAVTHFIVAGDDPDLRAALIAETAGIFGEGVEAELHNAQSDAAERLTADNWPAEISPEL